jgi:hypothetical protein
MVSAVRQYFYLGVEVREDCWLLPCYIFKIETPLLKMLVGLAEDGARH